MGNTFPGYLSGEGEDAAGKCSVMGERLQFVARSLEGEETWRAVSLNGRFTNNLWPV